MADPTPAEVRAEGRRLLAEWRDAVDTLNAIEGDPQGADWVEDVDTNLADFFYRNADVLLADPECDCTDDDEPVSDHWRALYYAEFGIIPDD